MDRHALAPTPSGRGGVAVRWGWPRLITASVARVALLVLVTLGLWGAVPVLLGWHSTTVMSGSMQPKLMIGDIAVAKPTDDRLLRPGQVLLFDDPDHAGRLRLHRFVGTDDDGRLITRGDANATDDSTHVDAAVVRGVGVLRIPYVATPIVWLRDGRFAPAAGAAAALIALMIISRCDRDLRRGPDDPSPTGTDPGPGPAADDDDPVSTIAARTTPVTRAFIAGFVVLAVAVGWSVSVGAPAWARYTRTTATAANLASADAYSCSSVPALDQPAFSWKLDETSGTVAADAVGTRTGVYQNAPVSSTDVGCGGGRSRSFNGANQFVAPSQSSTVGGVFSIEVWIKTSQTGLGRLAGISSSPTGLLLGSTARSIYLNNGLLSFEVVTALLGIKNVTTTVRYNDNVWHHVVATLSSSGMRLYVDGALSQSDTSVTTAPSYTGYWRLAQDGGPLLSGGFYSGLADGFAVYDTALSATRVKAHWDARTLP